MALVSRMLAYYSSDDALHDSGSDRRAIDFCQFIRLVERLFVRWLVLW